MLFLVKKYVRRKLNFILSYGEYLRDASRFRRSCIAFDRPKRHEQWRAILTIDYHRIEKGLALPEPREGFGHDVVLRLMKNTPLYVDRFGIDDLVDTVLACLHAYMVFNEGRGLNQDFLKGFLQKYDSRSASAAVGGTVLRTKNEVLDVAIDDPEAFFMMRSSVRQFSEEEVSENVIRRVALLAARTPSVCNRQPGRLYYTVEKNKISRALDFQNGNRGFGHAAPALFVVCSEFDIFEKLDERNQGWIDGGLYAMSVVFALHSLGLGSCMLNWSVSFKHDSEFRKIFNIPESQGVVCMIAVGHLKDTYRVAQSPRRSVDDYLFKLSEV